MPASPFIQGFAAELTKTAARAGLKLIRNLVEKGELEHAERLAITPGVLKKTQAGSQIKQLGAGAEGVSTLIAHPKKGIAVRKIYDPKGIDGPEMVARKADVGRKLSDSSDAAKFLGEAPTRIGPAHLYEHVPGKPLGAFAEGTEPMGAVQPEPSTAKGHGNARAKTQDQEHATAPVHQIMHAKLKRLEQRGAKEGVRMADLHPGNVITDASGHGKAVDYLPIEKGKPHGFRPEAVEQQDDPNFRDYLTDPRRSGNLMGRAFRGAPPLSPYSIGAARKRGG
jgi:hypothetical protein